MPRPPKCPKAALTVRTYGELDRFVRAFAEGKFNLLIIVGRPGLQKTRVVRAALGPDADWIDGNATAFGMYLELWRHRDRAVVIDDVDSLYADRAGVRLLKCLCQTEVQKRVGWHSDATALAREGTPRQFVTESRVLIIANQWRSLNVNVTAVEDRGHVIVFEPSALEVHIRTAEWFWDQEVFDFIAQWLHLIPEPSMRDYWRAWELRQANLDWRRHLIEKWGLSGVRLLVVQLKNDLSFPTEEERVQVFIRKGGGCRATYFNHARKLRARVEVPRIILRNGRPNKPVPPSAILDLVWERYGHSGDGQTSGLPWS